MKKALSGAIALALIFSLSTPCFGDFQYRETSKMTGGAAMGAMKMAGIFSKDARQTANGMESTISVRRNKMRHEESNGMVTIYDLDARKVTHLDLKHKTYNTITFDEMRAQMEEARKKAEADRAKHAKVKNANEQVKIVPKVKIVAGKGSKKILDYTAKEMKTQIDMQMQGQDDSGKQQSGDMWVSADSYYAPVKGYDEVKQFYIRMAKELNWLPGAAMGGNVQVSPAMVEYQKSVTTQNGMPLQTMMSVGMGTPQEAHAPVAAKDKKESGNAVTRGLGGMFGKKKKQDDSQQAGGGSLMDMQTDVLEISTKSLGADLFAVPAGFTLDTKSSKGK
jgi:hypothetical protein